MFIPSLLRVGICRIHFPESFEGCNKRLSSSRENAWRRKQKVSRDDIGWLAFALGMVFPPLVPGVKSAGLPLIIGIQKNDIFVKSAPLLVAQSQNSDSGNEGRRPGAASAQLLSRNLMELTLSSFLNSNFPL